jgi:tRNA threonylcarbamoyladenosine biosynthesis protein TsaB
MSKTVLAIETTGRVLSVALATDGGVIERRSDGELRHLTDLVPTVRELIDADGVEFSSLAYIAVSAGPGSFTGIRIGVSAARAMAQVAGLKVVKAPTLETFVYGYEPGEIVCPMLDARRGQVYCGAYRLSEDGGEIEALECVSGSTRTYLRHSPDAGALEALVPGDVRTEDEFDAALGEALSVSGAGAYDIRRVRDEDEPQSAAKVLRWAESFGELIDYAKLEPIYMRKAEAQRKLEERLAADAARVAGSSE